MSQFEFFMTFYGLLLGLAVAELFGGFARILQERTPPRLGLILPMLGMIALIELIATFIDAWSSLQSVAITLQQLIVPTAIALAYFSLAAILVPRHFEDWPDLDVYFDRRRIWIIGLLLVANLLLIVVVLSTTVSGDDLTAYALRCAWLISSYAVLLLSRRRWLDIAAASSVIVFYAFTYVAREIIRG